MKNVLSILLLFFSIESLACMCMHMPGKYERADIVFSGQVISVDPVDSRKKDHKSHTLFGATISIFEPTEVFKNKDNGIDSKDDTYGDVFILQGGSNCSISFEEGSEYLIYANYSVFGVYSTSSCKGSRKIDAKIFHEIDQLRENIIN